jgi:molybdopterin converting factor small subunit
MDGFSLAITVATTVKEVVTIGHAIKSSIEQVKSNKEQLRALTGEIVTNLANIQTIHDAITSINPSTNMAPLLQSLTRLQLQMEQIQSKCRSFAPGYEDQKGRLRSIKKTMKAYWKKDELRAALEELNKNVSKCYQEFTVRNLARI